jgi:pre-rRNA-processing protein TSR3
LRSDDVLSPPDDILILRDPRESIQKCSLTPLRGLPGIRFVDYHGQRRLEAHGRVLLDPRGEELTPEDAGCGLLLIDCAWRRVDALLRTVDGELHPRRLPDLNTAYPRKSRVYVDPERGLASVEALYVAALILGRPRPDLLQHYRWREPFLRANPGLAGGTFS